MYKDLNILELDEILMSHDITWDELVKIHNSSHDSKTINLDGVAMNVSDILMYIRSMSRLLIHYYVSQQQQVDSKFVSIAAGSTNITSDFDVTFIGKLSYLVCQRIVNSFRSSTRRDLADIADSNVYISPGLIIYGDITYPKWFQYIITDPVKNTAFPLPVSNVAITEEIRALLKRSEFIDDRSISDKYNSMIKHGKLLEENYYYPITGTPKENETDFWKLLHKINFDAMEAYITLSTILTVVVEIQMGYDMSKYLTEIHYIISALENIINFTEHMNGKTDDSGKLLKNSKYIYRILYCLLKTTYNTKMEDIDYDNVKYIVSQRSNPNSELYSSSQFEKYKEDAKFITGLADELKRKLISHLPSTSRKKRTRKIRKRHVKKTRRT